MNGCEEDMHGMDGNRQMSECEENGEPHTNLLLPCEDHNSGSGFSPSIDCLSVVVVLVVNVVLVDVVECSCCVVIV